MLQALLAAGAPRSVIPLVLIQKEGLAAWLKKQPAAMQNFVKGRDYKPKPGSFLAIPGKTGKTEQVLACVSDPVCLWDLAALPKALREGVYGFEAKVREEDQKILALGWMLGGYRFTRYKKAEGDLAKLALGKGIDRTEICAKAEAMALARDLITTPAADMGPVELAAAVQAVAKKYGAKVTEIVGDDLLKKNYPAIHAVGRASVHRPRLIDLTWGNPKHPLVTLVGKGVCFDTGGLDLKPSSAMYLMRKDMGGAAVALGVALLVMARKLPVRLRLLIPAVENAVSGNAFRPSDILKMRNGLTVEVGNTDAEGRLVLADALAEAASEKPALIIDFATLTGAARSAVGTDLAALFTNDDLLAADLSAQGGKASDPVWRLPLHEAYDSQLESAFADVNSCPNSPYAGAITAALFLQRFIGKAQNWIHLDFMAWNISAKPGRPEGGEGQTLRAVYGLLEKRFARS